MQKFSAAGTLLGKLHADVSVASFAVDNDGFMYVAPDAYGDRGLHVQSKVI